MKKAICSNKECRVGGEQELTEFYYRPKFKTGRTRQCRTCILYKARKRKQDKIDAGIQNINTQTGEIISQTKQATDDMESLFNLVAANSCQRIEQYHAY